MQSFKLIGDALDWLEQLQESRIRQGLDYIKEWFDMRQLIKDYFVHCVDIQPSFVTLIKVEDDEILGLYEIFKEEVQLTFYLCIEPNSVNEFL